MVSLLDSVPRCRLVTAWAVGGVLAATLLVGKLGLGWYLSRMFRQLGEKYRNQCQERLRTLADRLAEANMDPARVEEITSLSLSELIQKLQSGEWKAREVLAAYQIKALQSHAKTNCLVEPFVEAESWADACDKADDKSKPLHGVPVSLKEVIGAQGYTVSQGMGKFCTMKIEEDWHIVKVLLELGAVPFVRTGTPQMLMSYEGSNPIFGTIRSHLDDSRTPGGSSSGEGALIGDGGSILGMGTDHAGSIRVPAAFSGICGLRPGRDRVGYGPTFDLGQKVVQAVWGPMARDVESVAISMKALLCSNLFKHDYQVAPLPFRDTEYRPDSPQPLRIGYYMDDGLYPASHPCRRAVQDAVKALEGAGHTLVEWSLPDADFVHTVMPRCVSAEGGRMIKPIFDYELIDPCVYSALALLYMQPLWMRKVRAFILRTFYKRQKHSDWITAHINDMSVKDWWKFVSSVETYRKSVVKQLDEARLDAVVSPAFILPTPSHGNSEMLIRMGGFVTAYNVLDWPAGVVPVRTVSRGDIRDARHYTSEADIAEFVRRDLEGAEGMPVAVQVAAKRWHEELVLRVMREVETGVQHMEQEADPEEGLEQKEDPEKSIEQEEEVGEGEELNNNEEDGILNPLSMTAWALRRLFRTPIKRTNTERKDEREDKR